MEPQEIVKEEMSNYGFSKNSQRRGIIWFFLAMSISGNFLQFRAHMDFVRENEKALHELLKEQLETNKRVEQTKAKVDSTIIKP